ncbi:nuclear transport factor 2 family protein [Nocardia alni]|uniref:nuclear transport factor 2 family protein n=1 Tax=Nocardia alni TaxID=2815723 RepID=UPI001C234BC4|nr:nuclear transport factor 2 family protein [Nocardia alni]
MSTTPDQATVELAENWVKALKNIDLFREISTEDCQVWHSADDKWVSVAEAVAAVYERSGDDGVPDFHAEGITYTEDGFFNRASTEVQINGQKMKLHLVQIVEARDGKAVRVREYIGPEMGVQP